MAIKKSPATESELTALICAAQGGDQTAFESLLERYAPLIDSMVQSHMPIGGFSVQDREDFRQEALLAFYRALMRYETKQGEVQFGLYAKLCIKNALYSYLRKLKSQTQPVLLADEDVMGEADPASDPASRLMEQEAYMELSRLIHDALSEYENRIWWLYLSGRTAKEIADHLGRDERSVQNAVYRIRKKLRTVIPYS